MRTNDGVWKRSLWSVVFAAAIGLAASDAAAQNTSVRLIAAPVTKSVTLPDGTVVPVSMWGYALDTGDPNTNCTLGSGETVTVPGPRITVAPGDATLTIELQNCLPEATSLVIPGQPLDDPSPVTEGGRIRAMTKEAAANGGTATYTFSGVKPGTFLYQSGSHPAVQVQMGLYGAMTQDANLVPTDPNPRKAYPGVGFDRDVVLLFSEIDLALHHAVCPSIVAGSCTEGTYGTSAGPTSTVDYRPSLFLINGESYTDAAAAIDAGPTGEVKLLRMLNAGLRTHAPVLDRGSLEIVAEDGNKLPFAKDQATVLLAAGKTHDVRWRPGGAANAGVYSLYDRTLSLNARGLGAGQGSAGMLVKLRVSSTAQGGRVTAVDNSYSTIEGSNLTPDASRNVLSNDTWRDTVANGSTVYPLLPAPNSGTSTATLVTTTHAGTLSLQANGTFSYVPASHFFGVDSFTYQAHWTSSSGNTLNSEPATVTIAVGAVATAPVAIPQSVGVDQDGNVSVTLSATDADGDSLTYYLTALPTHGKASYIDPVTKIETPLTLDNRRGAAAPKAIPGGLIVYVPTPAGVTPGYTGPDAFAFVASDGGLDSAPAAVDVTVHPVEASQAALLTQDVTLTVRGADGAPVTAYRWTLEEDLTYKVEPGVADPNTLAVSFHKSYMPVLGSGCFGAGCDTPTKPMVYALDKPSPNTGRPGRYFVSVLPTAGTYSNGGAEIEAGQAAVTVTVSNLPLPTARIRVRVFQDNAPLNGMWDSTEAGLAGFQVTIDDAGGTYGMSGGHQSTDAFGNKLGTTYKTCSNPEGCDSYEVAKLGDGFVLTDADGYAVIENLVMGKYTVKVRAPGGNHNPNGDTWIQTSTIEGAPGIDAWVKPNEPQFFTEFGPPGPHVEVGFTKAVPVVDAAVLSELGLACPCTTITGRVTNLRQSRPPEVAQFSGAPFDAKKHTRIWVALNSGATGGQLLYAKPTNENGTFSIAGVPAGSYQLMVFDSALDIIIGSTVVNVAGAAKNVGDVAVFSWFTNLYSYVYDDSESKRSPRLQASRAFRTRRSTSGSATGRSISR